MPKQDKVGMGRITDMGTIKHIALGMRRSNAEAGLTYDCCGHTQYYCNGYSHGFSTYENNSQQQTQCAEINVKGNGNYIGVNQEQSSSVGSNYPALRDDNNGNGNGNGYDSSIQPGQANPSCKVFCLAIVR